MAAQNIATAFVALKRRTDVRQMRNELLEISVMSRDPNEAANIANEIANVYRAQVRERDKAAPRDMASRVQMIESAAAPTRPVFPSLRLVIGSWCLALTSILAGFLLRRS